MPDSKANTDLSRLVGLISGIVIVAALYLARIVFIPFALALLFSLLLTPFVSFLEKIKVPRVLAIFLVVITLVGLLGLLGWKTSRQLMDLTEQVPTYKKTLQDKIHAVKGTDSPSLHKASDTVKELEREIDSATPSLTGTEAKKTPATPGYSSSRPMAVEVVSQVNPLDSLQTLLAPLATGAGVIIFTIFILAGREDLRNRLVRLAGGSRIQIITQAMDDVTHRINRYLFLQLMVNSVYGTVIGVGLYFIGIPNAALWGVAAAMFRFLPYIGPILATVLPILLALAVFPGWHQALFTAGLFAVLELIVGNVVEPLLYGAHLGLSPLAVLVAAVFWTLIWGFPGLVLSTPLTVCVVVIGRYVPGLSFLNVLLGDEPMLSPQAHYYQRLLARDRDEARRVLEQQRKGKSLEELYSSVVIPALALAENDRHHHELDGETQAFIFQSTREFIQEIGSTHSSEAGELGAQEAAKTAPDGEASKGKTDVLCLPARDEADQVVAMLLAQLLSRRGLRAESASIDTREQMLERVAESDPACLCICALPPFAIGHAQSVYATIRAQLPDLKIIVCVWQPGGNRTEMETRLKLAAGDCLLRSLPDVLQHLSSVPFQPAAAVGK